MFNKDHLIEKEWCWERELDSWTQEKECSWTHSIPYKNYLKKP